MELADVTTNFVNNRVVLAVTACSGSSSSKWLFYVISGFIKVRGEAYVLTSLRSFSFRCSSSVAFAKKKENKKLNC